MIEAIEITKDYGSLRAVDRVSFSVPKGQIVGLLGPNGAGKTTTMRILTGYMPPTSGTAKIAGFDLFEATDEAKRRVGYLPETPPLYPEMTVLESLNFVGGLMGIPKKGRKEKVERAMERVGLAEVRRRLVGHISKGFRQRVGLAQALVHDPPVLILDEPTIGLDPKQILEIRGLIQKLAGEKTVILSSHILQEIQTLCERVVIIHHGRIVADDSIAKLSQQWGKSRLLVTSSESQGVMKKRLAEVSGVEEVREIGSSLEEIFLSLTEG
ncbi:MAG: ABC transporter ATP-binding protein [Deltaproteobacteria bacterium]|nr:ABC transporter ATP-binding protein [Deltaproteobacteria bacterium]